MIKRKTAIFVKISGFGATMNDNTFYPTINAMVSTAQYLNHLCFYLNRVCFKFIAIHIEIEGQ